MPRHGASPGARAATGRAGIAAGSSGPPTDGARGGSWVHAQPASSRGVDEAPGSPQPAQRLTSSPVQQHGAGAASAAEASGDPDAQVQPAAWASGAAATTAAKNNVRTRTSTGSFYYTPSGEPPGRFFGQRR